MPNFKELTRKSDGQKVKVNAGIVEYLEPTGPKMKQTLVVLPNREVIVSEDIATVQKKLK